MVSGSHAPYTLPPRGIQPGIVRRLDHVIETSAGVVVAGAGAAGHSAARTLRRRATPVRSPSCTTKHTRPTTGPWSTRQSFKGFSPPHRSLSRLWTTWMCT